MITAAAGSRLAIAEVARGLDLQEIAGRYVRLKRKGHELWGCCPFHRDRKPSFKVNEARGTFRCFGCDAHGDALDFLCRVEGLELPDLLRRLGAGEGLDGLPRRAPPNPALQAREDAQAEAKRDLMHRLAMQVWRDTMPITAGSVAASYLKARGCALPHLDGDLRFLESHRHPCGHVGPALVAMVTHVETAAPLTLHRTWVLPDGTKAEIDRPRLLWPELPSAGGVVRLSPDDTVTTGLAVAEGIETALALARGFGFAWSCLYAQNVRKLPVLAGIECLTVAEDQDRAGREAAAECAARWSAAGAEVRIVRPSRDGTDLADEAVA